MSFSKPRKLVIAFAAIVLLGLAVAWIRSSPVPLTLTFLYLTNSPSGRTEGVFRLDNNLGKDVRVGAGVFQMENRHRLAPHPTDVKVDVDLSPLSPGTSTTFQLPTPTTGRRYRLILGCLPESRVPPLANSNSVKGRIHSLLIHSPLPVRFKAFVMGISLAVSPCFRAPEPN